MFALMVMLFTIAVSIFQLLHHFNLAPSIVPALTYLWSGGYPIDPDAIRRRIQFTALKSDQRDALQPCWNVEKPCWPEDAPAAAHPHDHKAAHVSQEVGAVLDGWFSQLVYDLYAIKSFVAAFPVLTGVCLVVCLVYTTHVARIMRILPKSAEDHFRSILGLMEAAHKEIESKSSQTSQHLIGGVRTTIDNQESRSLEVVMDILNEMNEGLTMQQWYEQEKLNIMMEDDLRASRTSSRYSRAATDVNKLMRDLNRYSNRRDKRLSKLKESRTKAETSFQKCYELIGDLEGVRNICDDDGFDKRFPRVR